MKYFQFEFIGLKLIISDPNYDARICEKFHFLSLSKSCAIIERERIAHFTRKEKHAQVQVFRNALENILSHPNAKHCHGKAEIIFYDGKSI